MSKIITLTDYYYLKTEIDEFLRGKASTSHTHGNITSDGVISNQANKNVVTDANGKITTEAKPTIPTGSTSQAGIVKLNSATNSTSTSEAATPSAVSAKTVTLTKLSTATAGYIATYEVKQGGTSLGKIDIPKDYLVKSGSVKTVSTANNPVSGYAVGDKYIDFIINTKDNSDTDEHIYINVKDLVDVYTHPNSGVTAGTNYNGNQTPAFGATFNIPKLTFNAQGHITASANSTVKIPNTTATTSAAGLMSAADKQKLDGMASGGSTATDHNHDGSYIKTGTGTVTSTNIADGTIVNADISSSAAIATSKISGLDTTLNGKVNTNDSRLTDARTPKFNQITATASNIQDLNNYKTGGFYYCNSDVNNAPYIIHCPWSNGTATPYTGNKSFFLLVETWGTTSTYVKQTLTYYNANNTFVRTCNNGTWTSWKEFNTNNNDYLRAATRVISGEAIAANNIICGSTDSKYYQLKSGKIIDIKYPILFNTSAITSGSYTDNVYLSHTGVPLTNNVSGKTVTSQKQVYIEGTSFDGKQFVVSDRVFVSDDQISNTTDLGKYYIYIGASYSTTNIRFNSFHQTVYVETKNGLVPVGDNTHNPHMLFKSDAGTAGYFKFLTIRTTGTYHDQTIEFDTTHRGNKPKTVVSFNFNTYEKTSGSKQYYTNIQAFYYHGHPTPVYYIQTNDGVLDATFDFYIRRETWDEMGVSDLRSSTSNYNGMTVTWHNEFVTALPTGTTQATLNPYYAQVGHTHSYLPLSGGTLTGAISSNSNITTSGTVQGATIKKTNGTSSQFLKADGSVDSNTYLTTSSASSTYQPKGNYLTSHNPVDTALSSTSTNAVQNKVINTALSGKANSSHTHGNITNDGKVGTTATLPLITGTGGIIQAGSFGTTAGTFCQGNDSRLSNARTPTSHTHGNITNAGAIGSTANLPIITGTNGVLQASSFGTGANTFCQGNDSRLSNARTPIFNTVGASSSSTKDLNNFTTGGFYYCDNDSNAPYVSNQPRTSGQKAFFLLVETWGASSNYVKQTLTYYDTNQTYTRTKAGSGGWKAWVELSKDTDTTYSVATQSANGLLSSTDKKKLDGITESADSVSFTQTKTSGIEIGKININGTSTTLYQQDNNTTYSTATTSANGLMSSGDKTKLDGIATNANNYSHPTNLTALSSDLYKITTNNNGHVTAGSKVTIDSTPANNANNLITSKAVYDGLAGKAASNHSHARTLVKSYGAPGEKEVLLYAIPAIRMCFVYFTDVFSSLNANTNHVVANEGWIPEEYRPIRPAYGGGNYNSGFFALQSGSLTFRAGINLNQKEVFASVYWIY